jgi:hypothetical protein
MGNSDRNLYFAPRPTVRRSASMPDRCILEIIWYQEIEFHDSLGSGRTPEKSGRPEPAPIIRLDLPFVFAVQQSLQNMKLVLCFIFASSLMVGCSLAAKSDSAAHSFMNSRQLLRFSGPNQNEVIIVHKKTLEFAVGEQCQSQSRESGLSQPNCTSWLSHLHSALTLSGGYIH